MLPIWSRFKNSVFQNLTAAYFRGLFVYDTHIVPHRLLAYQKSWWPTISRSNKLVTGGFCVILIADGSKYFSTANTLNNLPISQKLQTLGYRGRKHSSIEDLNMSGMQIKILPALSDNYMYLIICTSTREAAVVDPVEPKSVIEAVKQENLNLTKILTTHHHWDHAGGNEKLVKLFDKPLEVCGGDERIGALNHKVKHDDRLKIGDLNVTCIFTPCHTTGHICYYIEAPNGEKCVFTGDTLFQAGCGRFFEGTAEQMYAALVEKLAALPDETKVFCGHEYTLHNMFFARHVEPQNENILKRIQWAKLRRATHSPTVPSTIAEEKLWNPFMRVHEATVQSHVRETDPIRTMASLRKEKDNFKG